MPEEDPLLIALNNHIAMMDPHHKERRQGSLLIEARDRLSGLLALVQIKEGGPEFTGACRPCPFCGHDIVSAKKNPASHGWSMFCGGCQCEGPHEVTYEQARTRWNARAEVVSPPATP